MVLRFFWNCSQTTKKIEMPFAQGVIWKRYGAIGTITHGDILFRQ